MDIMQNRVKRLLFEEERARRLSQLAKVKADKMLEARDRHQKELYDKFRFYDMKMREVNNSKERNFILKTDNKDRIQRAKELILKEKLQNREVTNIVSKVLDEKKSKDREEDINFKKSKKFHLLYEKNQCLTKKIKHLEDHH